MLPTPQEAERARARRVKVKFAQEIVLRATRRMGEILAETPKHRGNPDVVRSTDTTALVFPPKLSELGVTKDQSSRAQKVAAVPTVDFEHYLTTSRELTLKGVGAPQPIP